MQAPDPRTPPDDLEPRLFVVPGEPAPPAEDAGEALSRSHHPAGSGLVQPCALAPRWSAVDAALSNCYSAVLSEWVALDDVGRGQEMWDDVVSPLLLLMARARRHLPA